MRSSGLYREKWERTDVMDLLTDTELQAIPDSVAAGKFDAPLDEYSWTIESTPVPEQPGV